MSGFSISFVAVMCLLVFLTGSTQATMSIMSTRVAAKKLSQTFVRSHSDGQSRDIHDIVVVIDGSGSVGSCAFEKGKKALHYLLFLRSLYADITCAAVTFSNSAKVNFKFLPYSTAVSKIDKLSYPRGATNTQAGLAEAKKLFDDFSSGRRFYSTKRTVLLVTDGQSNLWRPLTIPRANDLKNSGVDIYVVAVGRYFNGIEEIRNIASDPPEDNILWVADFWDVIKELLKEIAPSSWSTVHDSIC